MVTLVVPVVLPSWGTVVNLYGPIGSRAIDEYAYQQAKGGVEYDFYDVSEAMVPYAIEALRGTYSERQLTYDLELLGLMAFGQVLLDFDEDEDLVFIPDVEGPVHSCNDINPSTTSECDACTVEPGFAEGM